MAPRRPLTHCCARHFSVQDPVRERAYLQCLDNVSELVGDEAGQLRSGQRNAYYRALVATGQLAGVPLGANDTTYRDIIKGQCGQLGQLEDEAEKAESSDESIVVVVSRPLAARPAKRKAAPAPSKSKRQKRQDWALALCPALGSAGPALPAIAPAQLALTDAPGQPGGAASSSSGLQPQGDAAAGAAAGAAEASRATQQQTLPEKKQHIILEGATVTYEKHGQQGQPGSYERLRAKCPFHPNCHGQRSFSARFAKQASLPVDLEPYAFIGLWLSKREDPRFLPGQDGQQKEWHDKWKPDAASIARYAREQGWV